MKNYGLFRAKILLHNIIRPQRNRKSSASQTLCQKVKYQFYKFHNHDQGYAQREGKRPTKCRYETRRGVRWYLRYLLDIEGLQVDV